MNSAVIEVLRRARSLISTSWAQWSFAIDYLGSPVGLKSPDAVKFCAVGACHRISPELGACAVDELRESLPAKFKECGGVGWFNDANDLPTVLALFDKTIARLEAEGA